MASSDPAIAQLQRQCQDLSRKFDDLRMEVDAILSCVEKRGENRRDRERRNDTLHAEVCNEKFELMQRRHPELGPTSTPTLADVLDKALMTQDVLALCGLDGPSAWRRLREASSSCSVLINPMRGEKVCIFGGASHVFGSFATSSEATTAPVSGTWSTLPRMLWHRVGSVAGVLHGRLYVCGGTVRPGHSLASIERFTPATQLWENKRVPPMHKPRAHAAAAVVQNRLYVCGGEDQANHAMHASTEFLVLKPEEQGNLVESWDEASEMSKARRCFAAANLPALGFLVCGGIADGSPWEDRSATVEVLGPAGSWEPVQPMQWPRWSHAATALGGFIYVCGGTFGEVAATNSVERFDPESGAWTSTAPMLVGRAYCSVVAMGSQVYVLGGLQDFRAGSPATNTVETYYPDEDRWEMVGEMLHMRHLAPAVVVKTGIPGAVP